MYSIDLSTSWTNQSVEFNAIPKLGTGPATLIREGLWLGPDDTFYSYGGGFSYWENDPDTPPNQLWQFHPNGNSGSWSQITFQTSSFLRLKRTYYCIYASTEGLGFALGGIIDSSTNSELEPGPQPGNVPGVVVFNSTSQEWYNVSTSGTRGYSLDGMADKGAAHFVPSFGPIGLLMIFGGEANDGDFASFDSVHMYEPLSQQWQSQFVTGDIPTVVEDPCVVGLAGDDGTYEVVSMNCGMHECC